MSTTVYIGRFNPFHLGHAHVLARALSRSSVVVVLVGSSFKARDTKNPFTFDERRKMIEDWHAEFLKTPDGLAARNTVLYVKPVEDKIYSNNEWVSDVQSKVHESMQLAHRSGWLLNDEVHLTGSDRDDSTWYLHMFPQWKLDLVPAFKRPNFPDISATSVRDIVLGAVPIVDDTYIRLCQKVPPTTAKFLVNFLGMSQCRQLRDEYQAEIGEKIKWRGSPYPPMFITTDTVVIQSGHVLVVQRARLPGRGLYAVPGGFLKTNLTLAQNAIEELLQETDIKIPEPLLYTLIENAPTKVFDAPGRSLRGRTVTHGFLLKLDDGKPLPKVRPMKVPAEESGGRVIQETSKALWMPLHQALNTSDIWFEDHRDIIRWGASHT